MQQKIKDLNCVDITSSPLPTDNTFEYHSHSPKYLPVASGLDTSSRKSSISAPLIPNTDTHHIDNVQLNNRHGSISLARSKQPTEMLCNVESKQYFKKFTNTRTERLNQSMDEPEKVIVDSSDYDSDTDEAELCKQSRYVRNSSRNL